MATKPYVESPIYFSKYNKNIKQWLDTINNNIHIKD